MLLKKPVCAVALLILNGLVSSLPAQQASDEAYDEKIAEYTTDSRFVNEMVDHLPYSEEVPSPLDHFGTIIGAPGILHYTHEIYDYLGALAQASPRVMVREIGKTEENRDMIEVIVSSEENIEHLERNRRYLNRLADPRSFSESEVKELISRARPTYYVVGGLHSTETGAPEMLMELAYRLAVEESPLIESIRNNTIFIFCPVAEPDGRDRQVDAYRYRAAHRGQDPHLVYWGKYVAHDNNRDALGMALKLSRNLLGTFLHWKPQVMHDLHESVSYLYTSTGRGPYNEHVDPITIGEWHNLAYEEVTELTRRGMPGVWTHALYNGWAANYMSWMANIRNSIGRFYETFGNSVPETVERTLTGSNTSRKWYRPNPPLEKALWSLRNNTNYMQSGVLVALKYMADNHTEFVDNFHRKTARSIERGRAETPHAWVISPRQKRSVAAAELVNLLVAHGVEVHVAPAELRWARDPKKPMVSGDDESNMATAPAGSWIVRLDQPYRAVVQNLMAKQNYPPNTRPPYDDAGWTLRYLRNIEAQEVKDPSFLSTDMELLREPATVAGKVTGEESPCFLVNHNTEDNLAVFRFRLEDIKMAAAEEPFEMEGESYRAGTLMICREGGPGNLPELLERQARELSLAVRGVEALPDVSTHSVEVPRIALVHSWISTQDAGWWRFAFDHYGIPYAHLSTQDLAGTDLSNLDVIVMPRNPETPQMLVGGTTQTGDPIPWRQTEQYRHIGVIDETDDMRQGMGYEGVANLKRFIERGGVFITEGPTAAFPIDMAITRRISIKRTRDLVVRGSVLKAEVNDRKSPIAYGYENSFPVYFSQAPVFQVRSGLGSYRTPDWIKDEQWEKEVPRTVISFAKRDLLMSGMLQGGGELAGKPAVVDVPVGRGHVVLFANRPFWRWETHGSHALVFNTMLHWNDLRTGWPERPQE